MFFELIIDIGTSGILIPELFLAIAVKFMLYIESDTVLKIIISGSASRVNVATWNSAGVNVISSDVCFIIDASSGSRIIASNEIVCMLVISSAFLECFFLNVNLH